MVQVSIHNTGFEYMIRDTGGKNIMSFSTRFQAIEYCRKNKWYYTYDL